MLTNTPPIVCPVCDYIYCVCPKRNKTVMTDNTFVWVLVTSTDWQGGYTVIGVHSTEAGAQAELTAFATEHNIDTDDLWIYQFQLEQERS